MKQVVITGMGAVTHFGYGVDVLVNGLLSPDEEPDKVNIEIAKDKQIVLPAYKVDDFIVNSYIDNLANYIYKNTTRMSALASMAVDEALKEQNVWDYQLNDVGISIASSLPSLEEYESLVDIIQNNPRRMSTSTIFRTLSNNVAFNIAKYLNIKGRVLSSSAACATSLQSIILGYEAIKLGKAKVMICGGSEEYHPYLSQVFHKLGIASKTKCKPFEEDRDGIVVSEGAGIVILEELEYAVQRGATIYGQIVGTGQNFTNNAVFSSIGDIKNCMKEAVTESGINIASSTVTVDAHATGTVIGDANELAAILDFEKEYNCKVTIEAFKERLGHTMAACGVLELIAAIKMALLAPFQHSAYPELLVKNSFGIGGINTSLAVKLPDK